MSASKQGPLTQQELFAIWYSSVDVSYSDPLVAAGDGNGLEAINQMTAQMARASTAVDITTQALYILPGSGQSNPPAAGGAQATVNLTFSRVNPHINVALRIGAGTVFFEEQAPDHAPDAGIVVPTGRRYTLVQDLVLMPGDSGPLTVAAIAEEEGYGYNNPQPGTISLVVQPGSGFNNTNATVTTFAPSTAPPVPIPPPFAQANIIAANSADMFVPDQVGQYMVFTAGANAGTVARMTAFTSPNPAAIPPTGSAMQLELLAVVASNSVTGTFTPGELVAIKSGVTFVGWCTFVQSRLNAAGNATNIAMVFDSGTLSLGNTLTGQLSGATGTVNFILQNTQLTPEAPPPGGGSGGASWSVLDWVADLGLTVTNAAQPTGGRSAMLDELGAERNILRAPGEGDDAYRQRVAAIADVVTPNAIKRTINRTLNGLPFCFREVGQPLLPGFYFDRVDDAKGDFWDDDVLIFGGSVTSGTFLNPKAPPFVQEPVQYQNAGGTVLAIGYLGRIDGGTTFTMIRRGLNTITSVNAGDKIVGLISGAVFGVTSQTVSTFVISREFHEWLDFTDMRAFFVVSVPLLGSGEFGFAYDDHPFGAYDASPFPDFYDGFPVGEGTLYKALVQSLDRVIAGGVGFTLVPANGPCTPG